MPSNHLVFCCLLLLLPSIFPSTRVSFPMSRLFASGGQSIGASAPVLTMKIQDLFPLGLTDLNSLQSKGLSRVFSSTRIQKYQFFSAQPSLWPNSYIHTSWDFTRSAIVTAFVPFYSIWILKFLYSWDLINWLTPLMLSFNGYILFKTDDCTIKDNSVREIQFLKSFHYKAKLRTEICTSDKSLRCWCLQNKLDATDFINDSPVTLALLGRKRNQSRKKASSIFILTWGLIKFSIGKFLNQQSATYEVNLVKATVKYRINGLLDSVPYLEGITDFHWSLEVLNLWWDKKNKVCRVFHKANLEYGFFMNF